MTADIALLQNYLVVGAILFAVGMVGFLVRRNMIIMFLCAEMMLQGVSLSLVAWSRYHNDWGGQMLVIFIIAVAACEAGIGLALILMLFHKSGRLDIAFWDDLREAGQPGFVDRKMPEERAEDQVWPTLTPAGIRPELDQDELSHRSRV
ncbi:NADH-quinone oxidoreductase subunit NuoK [Lignipirellula cremea]|uniref:NADH-quinone oxidoreductase subunit K n=1 Tax=Lignipirellula cremea TaxID=2528010 RepID=A0A518DQW6_9BACT|nr:NADH-quinone oxidoreductase subunit NuoK [Lignipirellula cremea]QDU94214.1 NADH-quinone oxidoreductase subunit K [Lignipirellula cremea]